MTQSLGDVFDLRYCEICKSSNEDNEGIPGKVSNSEDDAGFILCHKGKIPKKLFRILPDAGINYLVFADIK